MKIRNGFVSNSSSSSFIIAHRKQEPCPHCGRSDPDIISIINNSNGDDTFISADNYGAIIDRMKLIVDSDIMRDIIKKMDTLIVENYDFAMIDISYHEDTLINMVHDSKSIIILYEN